MINYGFVIDRLIIFGGTLHSTGGTVCNKKDTLSKIIFLEKDEKIIEYNGENCNFDNTYVVGKICIKTTKRIIGPFGSSGKSCKDFKQFFLFYFNLKRKFTT